jgi:hypothetical protein
MAEITVRAFIDADQFKKDVALNPSDIGGAMIEQASLFAHYSNLSAQAERQVNNIEMIVDIVRSKIDKAIRDQAADAGKKTTEPGIESAIARNVDYIKAVKKLNDAKMIANLAKNALEAFKHRKDMLVQLGAADREERKGELRLLEHRAASTASQSKRALAHDILSGAGTDYQD